MVVLFGNVIALVSVLAWSALIADGGLPLSLVRKRDRRRHPPLDEHEPPAWIAPLAGAVLVLALAALGLASVLDFGDGSQ